MISERAVTDQQLQVSRNDVLNNFLINKALTTTHILFYLQLNKPRINDFNPYSL